MFNLQKISPATYLIPKEAGMRVPGLIIATESLLKEMDIEAPLEQVRNVAHLPGIVGHSIAMPDMHWGYGFPIGGVAAFDAKNGIISPGGVGYDINCGVRLAIVPIPYKSLNSPTKRHILTRIFKKVPSGVGKGYEHQSLLNHTDYKEIAKKGAKWVIEQGYGFLSDLNAIESYGMIEGADAQAVSNDAKERGASQLGSVGSGNHFIEIGEVGHIYLDNIALQWGLGEGQTYILIHSGSRGFGHQVCQDTLNQFIKKGLAENLPDKQLVAAPIQSEEGQKYFHAMAMAANYAFCNRQKILHAVRESFKEVLSVNPEEIRLIYDVCHNIAKFETHPVDGKLKKLCVHRKGATRAFGPGAEELSPLFQKTGQPVLVPGDMARASHIMVGKGNPITWCSSCHGAGRAQSRHQSLKNWKGRDPIQYMETQGVEVMATSKRTITEEMPDAYKNVDFVVEAVQEAGLADRVARLIPRLVIKG